MIVDLFYKRGDMSLSRGFFIDVISYDDMFFGKPVFIGEEITEEEYDELLPLFEDPNVKWGFDGIVNDEGYAKYVEESAERERRDAM